MALSLLTAASTYAHALYNGNPAEPELIAEGFFLSKEIWTSIKFGYRETASLTADFAYQGVKGRIDDFSYLMNQGVLTFNFGDRADLYGSVGAIGVKMSNRPHSDGMQRKYETNDHVTWGVGARAILFRWGEVNLSGDFKYQHAHPRVKWITVNGQAFTTNAELMYCEWQVSLGVSRHIDIFTPYLALTYARTLSQMRQLRSNVMVPSHFRLKVREPVGLALGCGLSTSKDIDLNIEFRMFSEEAVTFAGNVKF